SPRCDGPPPGDHDHDAAGTATAGPGASTRKDAHPTRDDPALTDLGIRASGGDRQAWDALVERYAPLIWAICRGHQLRDAHADDVGQAVWLHLAGHLDSLRDPAPVTAWLATTRRECHRVMTPAARSCRCSPSRTRPGRADRAGVQRRIRQLPPGLTGKALATADKLSPALFGASMQQLRLSQARPAGTVRVRLVEIPGSYTLVPLDQPTAFARALSVFLSATMPPTAGAR
ncbi:MAG TPA: sigma-70 family RNA polymerase sigma factor, partial [Streptosporangiaceae bacterium]|nr:sigma-70 family RNA polymerase sigma factor [Streptosporangiaceae bacterium]